MGNLSDPLNRFYETFTSTGKKWEVSTPTGTTTNGGILISHPSQGVGAVAQFRELRFAAGVFLQNGTETGPGEPLPALALAPTALASQLGGGAVAVVTSSQQVEAAPSLGGPFRVAASLRTLAETARGLKCGLEKLTSVAVVNGEIFVGGQCSKPGEIGLFVLPVPGGAVVDSTNDLAMPGTTTILRLDETSDGVAVLALNRSNRGNSISSFLVSTADALSNLMILSKTVPSNFTLRSTSVAVVPTSSNGAAPPQMTELVTYRSGSVTSVALFDLVHKTVKVVEAPPSTRVVVSQVSGMLSALQVDGGNKLEVSASTAGGGWQPMSTVNVAIPYGSAG